MSFVRAGRGLVIGSIVLVGPFQGRAEEPPPCRAYLVPCNIGEPYSGTFHRFSTLKWAENETTEDVTVRVVHGKVHCDGSIASTDPSAEVGPIRGEGLLAVEWGSGTDDDPELPWYRIAVACPGVGGSSPARIDESTMDTYKQPRRGGFAVLEGSSQEEHPSADDVNGVTGTVRLKWSFSLDGAAARPSR